MNLTYQPTQMIQTEKNELKAALYGIVRLVSGSADWREVDDLPQEEKLKALSLSVNKSLMDLQADILNMDAKLQGQLVRKLRAYQQLLLLEKFCFEEVEWD